MMSFHSLRVFCAVVENKGFSKAANQLFISQPSVSAEIKSLEKKLDVILIERKKSRFEEFKLTEAGHHVYKEAKSILKSIDELPTSIKKIKEDKLSARQQTLVVTNNPIGIHLLPQLASNFYDTFPNGTVEPLVQVNYPTMVQLLQNEACDICILPLEIDIPNADVHFTFELELALVASEGYQSDIPWCISDLQLVLPPKTNFLRKKIDDFLDDKKITPNIMFESNHPEVRRKITKLKKLATIIHYLSVKDDLEQGTLVQLQPNYKLPSVVYQVVTNSKKQLTTVSKQFIEFLNDYFNRC